MAHAPVSSRLVLIQGYGTHKPGLVRGVAIFHELFNVIVGPLGPGSAHELVEAAIWCEPSETVFGVDAPFEVEEVSEDFLGFCFDIFYTLRDLWEILQSCRLGVCSWGLLVP